LNVDAWRITSKQTELMLHHGKSKVNPKARMRIISNTIL
jgi:hypothetical protein